MPNWSIVDLARASGVSVSTIKRVETGGPQPVSMETRLAVWDAFKAAGVQFLDDDGSGPGVRLRSKW